MAKNQPQPASRKRQIGLVAVLVVLCCALAVREASVWLRARRPLPRPTEELTLTPLGAPNRSDGSLFERLSADVTGIDFVGRIVADHPRAYLYETGFTSGGVAIGDFDNDGRTDVYLTSGPDDNRLYRQIGDFKFEDVTETAGVGGDGAWSAGAAMADIDNDGRLDIYVCNYDSPNYLYINQGDGTFAEAALEYGLDVADACIMAAFCDYDLDGDLDVYVLGNRYVSPTGRPVDSPLEYFQGRVRIRPEYEKYFQITPDRIGYSRAARSDALFRNEGDDGFTNVSVEAGVWGAFQGLSATWWDYNEDGLPDLYIGNDFEGPDQLYRNKGDGTFIDVAADVAPHTSRFSMGADLGDLDNDGRIDFVIADMARTSRFKRATSMGPMHGHRGGEQIIGALQQHRNAAFINAGVDRFMESAQLSTLDRTNWTWAVKLADFDNDGRTDVYFTNGFARDFTDSDYPVTPDMLIGRNTWELTAGQPPLLEQDFAFRNLGGLEFDDVSGEWGLDHVGISMAAAYGDLDRDGDLDMVVYNADGPALVYRNGSTAGNRAIVRLEGVVSNRYGLNAVVRISTNQSELVRELSPSTGYLSTNEPVVHFGLGEAESIKRLIVDWPSGHHQQFNDLPVNHLFTIVEPEGAPTVPQPPPAPSTLFQRSTHLDGARHRERPFDDYAKQPLLPHKLSQLGPGLAWADVDRDGDEDLFLAGAAGQAGSIWTNQGDGRFVRSTPEPLLKDREHEDMGAVWFDVEADGDLDLYVVSGGVEFGGDPSLLRDRLYLNDGDGDLQRAPADSLPSVAESGGPVAAADFDRDGDVDLFVGGRVVPGEYPTAAGSRLLRNDSGKLIEATEAVAPELLASGMATGALWTDVDDDGWPDLMVTHQWGPVKVYINREGRFEDATRRAGLSDYHGWWNGLVGGDFDHDGDLDYIATNLGRNTLYRPAVDRPVRLFYGDLDGSGLSRIVEAEYEADRLVPMRSKQTMDLAMPNLGERFPTFREFGKATVEQLFPAERLLSAAQRKLNYVDSAVLLNDGTGRFNVAPLPWLAQVAPSFGAATLDYDGDGNLDVALAQNFFTTSHEVGRMDGGLSLLLRSDGRGGFQAVPADRSGIVLPNDAKSLTAVDLDHDGVRDLAFGVNDADMATYQRTAETRGDYLTVRLQGSAGNPTSIGARVKVIFEDESEQIAEVYAGEGYLSQSPAGLVFGMGREARPLLVDVRWPTGKRSTVELKTDQGAVVVSQP